MQASRNGKHESPAPSQSTSPSASHSSNPSVVSIASSQSAALGDLRAPLDADLTTEQVAAIVWRALDQDTSPGNLRAAVKPGAWVAVKPNMVTSRSNPKCAYWYGGRAHPGQNTDLRVVKAVVDYLLAKCQPGRVSIAEGGAEWTKTGEADSPPEQTEDGWTVHWPEFDDLSYADLVANWAKTHPGVVDIVDLNYDELRFRPVPDPRGSGIGALQRQGATARPADRFGRDAFVPETGTPRAGYPVPATILDCDFLISLPAFKTHLSVGTSLTIKNYVGTMAPMKAVGHDPKRLPNSKSIAHDGNLSRGFVDAFCYHPSDYSVVESIWGTEGNGPQWGDEVQHNIVICGADPVAVDAIGSSIMGFNPEDLEYLQLAALKRLGEIDVRKVEVVGESLADATRFFVMGTGRSGYSYVGQGLRSWQVAAGAGDWRAVESESRYVDPAYELKRADSAGLGAAELDEVWAYTELECDAPVAAELWLGADGPTTVSLTGERIVEPSPADGPTTVFVSGARVVELEPADGHMLGEAKAKVELPAGLVGVLVRTRRSAAGCGFSLLACGGPGRLPLGVHYVRPDAGRATLARERALARAGRAVSGFDSEFGGSPAASSATR